MDINDEEKNLCQQLRERVVDLKITDSYRITDYNMIRYLRARNLDLDKAEDMFRKYVEWREELDLDNALNWDVPRDLKEHFVYRVTGLSHEGGLVICVNVAEWDPVVSHGRFDDLMKLAYHELEVLTKYSKYYSLQTDSYAKMVGIINLEGLTFAHCSTVEWLRVLIALLKAFEAYYPETLKIAYLINAPWVFSILWSITKPFISNATHERLRFLGAEREVWREEICQHAAEDQFPESFGGLLPNDYQLVFDENDKIVGKRIPRKSDNEQDEDDHDNGNEATDETEAVDAIELD